MGWTIFYMFVILKIPVLAALWLVWWAVRNEPAAAADGGDREGGVRPPAPRTPPTRPRRGPHGGQPPAAPQRTRIRARGRARAHG